MSDIETTTEETVDTADPVEAATTASPTDSAAPALEETESPPAEETAVPVPEEAAAPAPAEVIPVVATPCPRARTTPPRS